VCQGFTQNEQDESLLASFEVNGIFQAAEGLTKKIPSLKSSQARPKCLIHTVEYQFLSFLCYSRHLTVKVSLSPDHNL
jgi:hypothetical protein